MKRLTEIQIISIGLAALYGVSFAIYLYAISTGPVAIRGVVLACILGVLFVASIATIQLKEWGRGLLIFGNAVMGVYLLLPYLVKEDLIPISFIFMNVAILLFFTQERVKSYFTTSGKVSTSAWKSVLVVDDDELLIKTIRPILMSHGYSVLTADSGEDGLQIIRKQKPDLVILDVILPGIKGREVCRMIKEDSQTKDIPVIFLTAKDSPDDVKAEKEAGAIAHLTKPVNPKELIPMVQKVLDPKTSSV